MNNISLKVEGGVDVNIGMQQRRRYTRSELEKLMPDLKNRTDLSYDDLLASWQLRSFEKAATEEDEKLSAMGIRKID